MVEAVVRMPEPLFGKQGEEIVYVNVIFNDMKKSTEILSPYAQCSQKRQTPNVNSVSIVPLTFSIFVVSI
jgi:hypothetical protein